MRFPLFVALLSLLPALPGRAGDGVAELNQAIVEAAGGFPFEISEPGRWVLTGDLVVPDLNTTAIRIDASQVSINLNGFAVRGHVTECAANCPSGTGRGITATNLFLGRSVTVRNGIVTGFADDCIQLGARLSLPVRMSNVPPTPTQTGTPRSFILRLIQNSCLGHPRPT